MRVVVLGCSTGVEAYGSAENWLRIRDRDFVPLVGRTVITVVAAKTPVQSEVAADCDNLVVGMGGHDPRCFSFARSLTGIRCAMR